MTQRTTTRRRTDASHDQSSLLDRLPPHNLEAEKGVLGSILLKPDVADEVALAVRASDFYSPSHRRLYELMLNIHGSSRFVDTTILVDELKKTGEFETIGGTPFLAEIIQSVPTAHNAVPYARIVSEKAQLRRLLHVGESIFHRVHEGDGEDAREILAKCEADLFDALDQSGTGAEAVHVENVLQDVLASVSERMSGGLTRGIKTGLVDLDRATTGLHDGQLIILAGRPAMGKSALATTIAEHVTLDDRNAALIVSLEMSRLELAERMLCAYSGVNGRNVRSGRISRSERDKLVEGQSALSSAPLFIDDTSSRTITEIAASARMLKRRNKLKLIIIDYLQLIEPDNPKDPRQEQVAKISRRLKALARELKIPVLCLAQLNRQAEASRDNIPRLSHLRESGAIEQDADVVMFVHREEYYETNEEQKAKLKGKADIIIAKQRSGPCSTVPVVWREEITRFESIAREQKEYDFD